MTGARHLSHGTQVGPLADESGIVVKVRAFAAGEDGADDPWGWARILPMTGMVKSLWASIQGDPKFMRRVNGWFTIFWIVMIPISMALHLLSSVVYVSALSLWALVSGHWSAWQAARVEVAQQAEAEAREKEPIEEKVVNELVERTDVNEA